MRNKTNKKLERDIVNRWIDEKLECVKSGKKRRCDYAQTFVIVLS